MNILRTIVWFVDEPYHALGVLGWKVRLALVSYLDRVKVRDLDLTYKYMSYGWPRRWIRDLVDAVSPFDPWRGYVRQPLRAWIWKAVHPLVTMRLASLRWSINVLKLLTPYTGPGRFQQMDPPDRLKAEWLTDNPALATRETGDTDTFGLFALLYDITPPWSRWREFWGVTIDRQGFIYATEYATLGGAQRAFDEIEERFLASFEPFDEDLFDNREGQPEFNGAFR